MIDIDCVRDTAVCARTGLCVHVGKISPHTFCLLRADGRDHHMHVAFRASEEREGNNNDDNNDRQISGLTVGPEGSARCRVQSDHASGSRENNTRHHG